MSAAKVKEYLKKYNMDNRIITVPTTSATVKEAAEALGTEEARIAKTLSFKLKDKYIVIVTKGDVKIDNAKYRHTFGEKAHMVAATEVEEIVDAQWRDLGMPETLWHCRVKEFGPLIVSIDTEGRNLFEENKVIFNERKEKAIEEICKHVSFIK